MSTRSRPEGDGPRQLSYYQLEEVLGSGGMGTVYRATDTRNGIAVALKLLHPHLEDDETFRDRFQREAHVAALLRSPYTVQLLDYGFEQGRYYFVMKLVEGRAIREELRSAAMQPARALRAAAQVARALEEAETRGVVHRDIKPENIMIALDGTAQVLDFGIARQAGGVTLTQTGAFVGTLVYASPESFEGRADHRSDLYSLGATLYHMLAGRPPFDGSGPELMRQHRETPPPREPLDRLPDEVIDAILRCLEKDPADRFQTASELAGQLEHLSQLAAKQGLAAAELPPTEVLGPPRPTAITEVLRLELGAPSHRRRLLPRASGSSFELSLRNDGDAPLELELAAADPEQTCTFSLPERVLLGAREVTTVGLTVAPRRRRWRGDRQTRRFSVTASGAADGGALVVDGEFEDRPGGWLPYPGGALFAVALFVVLATLGGGPADDVPAALAASPTPDPVAAGALSRSPAPTPRARVTPDPSPAPTVAPTSTPAPAPTAARTPVSAPAQTAPTPRPTPERRATPAAGTYTGSFDTLRVLRFVNCRSEVEAGGSPVSGAVTVASGKIANLGSMTTTMSYGWTLDESCDARADAPILPDRYTLASDPSFSLDARVIVAIENRGEIRAKIIGGTSSPLGSGSAGFKGGLQARIISGSGRYEGVSGTVTVVWAVELEGGEGGAGLVVRKYDVRLDIKN